MEDTLKLALETIKKDKQAIVFVPSRASAEKTAEDISKLTAFSLLDLEEGILKAVSTPTKQCERLAKCLKKGVAFHHAGLTNKQKDLIEESFKDGKIKIICATPTLAAGLSLPVFRVIIKSLKRYSGKWGMDWIQVLEYLQMAGRAGRPEYETFGEAIVLAKNESEKQEIYDRYVCGEPEEIYSKLAVEPVLRTYLLSLISSRIIKDEKTMQEFFSKTFWAQQFKDMRKLEEIMNRMLSLLEKWDFVTITNENENKEKENKENEKTEDFVSGMNLELCRQKKRTMQPTLLGRRISELYLDPLTARHLLDCLANYDESKNSFSLLQMVSHTLEMRPLLRIKAKEIEYIESELIQKQEHLLKEEVSAFDMEYDEFMNSIKTALFFESWISENKEDFLLEKFGIRPGEIRYKQDTADWLLYASEELSKIKDYKYAIREIHKLRLQVKHGVKEELLPLLKLKGIGRIRARKLYSNSLKDLGDIKKADLVTLGQLLGKNTATNLKKQLGEDVQEIPKGKRKGQLSLNKF